MFAIHIRRPGMVMSTLFGIKKINFVVARRFFLIVFMIQVSITGLSGQSPLWLNGTPSVTATGPISIKMDVGIDNTGIVYISVFNYNNSSVYSSDEVKSMALAGPSGTRVAVAAIPVSDVEINTVLQVVLDVINSSTEHTIYIVAEGGSGILQPAPLKLFCTTRSCPLINILTGFTQPVICINKTPVAIFDVLITNPDPDINGILKGTQWTLDWGDGSTATYTSDKDNDIPPIELRTHTYSTISDCNYVFSNSIKNPCGQTRAVQYIAVVHGRDIPSDGDGFLQLVNNATGSTTIHVCEGTRTVITIRDDSNWNCQNPVLPGGLKPLPNLDPRNIEWLYGQDPLGAITNTITGDINIATMGNAPQASGRFSPLPYGPTSLSQAITIPATCRAGQYFRVYLKNWNKCNWPDPEYVDTFVDILVVAAPPAPSAAGKTICYDGDRTLTVTSPVAGTIFWYSDPALTSQVGTGTNYTQTQTAAGIYNYWIVDRSPDGLSCQSTPGQVTLVIREELPRPAVISGPVSTCPGAGGLIFSVPDNPPLMPFGGATKYTWSVPAGLSIIEGQGTRQISVNVGAISGDKIIKVGLQYATDPGCSSNTRSKTLSVYSVENDAGAIGGSNVCAGSTVTISGITGASTGTPASGGPYYSWDRAPGPAFTVWTPLRGLEESFSEDMAVPGVYRYRRTATFGCGTPVSATRDITVYSTINTGGVITGSDICAGGSVSITNITGASTGTPSSTGPVYTWDRAPGPAFTDWTPLSGSGPAFSEVMTLPGTYRYRRTAAFLCGTPATAIRDIVVSPLPAPSISGETRPCLNDTKTYTTALVTGHTYLWTVTNGVISGSSTSDRVNVQWNIAAGPGTLQVTETTPATLTTPGCSFQTPAYAVNINPAGPGEAGPVTGPLNVCNGQSGVIYSISEIAYASNYVWIVSPGAVIVSGQGTRSISIDFAAGAVSPITISVYPENSCGAGAPSSINVNIYNQLNAGVIGSNQSVCYNTAPVAFTSVTDPSGGTGLTFKWQKSPAGLGTWSDINGATGLTYTDVNPLISDTDYRRVTSSESGCGTVYSNIVEVKVIPLPLANLTGGETICPGQTSVLSVSITGGTGPYELDIENLGTVTRYTSSEGINVSPPVTTIYKLLRVRDVTGCEVAVPSQNLTGTATITVQALPVITRQPVSLSVCESDMARFDVTAVGPGISYQWEEDSGNGFVPVVNGGIYSGANTSTLYLTGVPETVTGHIYRVGVTGCSATVISDPAILTVNKQINIIKQPVDLDVCVNSGGTFSVEVTGTGVTYQWQINRGTGFVDVTDDGINFSGAAKPTLTLTNITDNYNNSNFRVIVSGTCGVPLYSDLAVLRVSLPPEVTLSPSDKTICAGNEPVVFSGNGTGTIDSLRWQVSSDDGVSWTDIHNNTTYSGSSSRQLTLINIPLTANGNLYRLAFIAKCTTVYSYNATLIVNQNPVVDFSDIDPLNACGDAQIVINGDPTGGSGIYLQHIWTGDTDPLSSNNVQSPTFSTHITGTYNLNYKVEDSNGCTASDDIKVIVGSQPADFTHNISSGCSPLVVTFNKDMTGIADFSWDFGDGSSVDSTDTNPVHTFINDNPSEIIEYNVTLTINLPGGCVNTFTSLITVYPSTDATFEANTNIVCSGNSITFSALPGANKYFWEFGDGVSIYSANITEHFFTNMTALPVVHQVKLTTKSYYNCTDVKTFDITVLPAPLVQFSAAPTSQEFKEEGNPVTFTNNTNPGNWIWSWEFGDGAISTEQDPVHIYTRAGEFIVTLSAGNSKCADSIQHSVRIMPKPNRANFDSIPSGCAPLTAIIKNTSLNTDAPGTTYRWDFGDGSFSTEKNPEYTWSVPGTYRVELTVTSQDGTSVKSRIVNSYPSPEANFEITPDYVFAGDEIVRCFNMSSGGDTYLWEFGDGDTSTLKEPFHIYMREGVFDITLHVFTSHGCSDMYIRSPAVTVEPAGNISFPNVFRPNKEGPIERTDLPTGGTEVDQFFFPPIREKVLSYKLQIFNRLGVLIFESHDINIPWNGYYKGKLCLQGVYIWYVEGKYANGQAFKKVGDLTLLH